VNAVRRRGIVVPVVFAIVACSAFIALGTWQVQRKAWKEGLIDALERRLSAPPQALPAPQQWPALNAAEDEFRRVSFAATFVPREEALVYASSRAMRPDVSGPGYWVLAPVRPANGAIVVVNRGFLPEGGQAMPHAAPSDSVMLTGLLRWPEAREWFAAKDDPAGNLWFVRDHVAIAAAKGWGQVAPFYVELETPTGDFPRAGKLTANLRNDHLQYAITWYGLAAVLAIAFGFWLRSRGREVSQGPNEAT
jgi:cytochrome oxidase assembly protein ShyY1